MKVALTGMDWFPNYAGGLNRYFYEQVEVLSGLGVKGVAIVSELKAGQTASMELRSMAQPGAGLRARWRGARRIIAESVGDGAQLINAHFAMYAAPYLRALPTGFPFVVHFHGPWAAEIAAERSGIGGLIRSAVAKRIERKVYSRATRVITLSHAFANLLCDDYGVDSRKVRVVPGGLLLDQYLSAPNRAAARRKLGWSQEAPILLSVRRLVKRVGLDCLIDAMPAVRAASPRVMLLIGGAGPLRDELEVRIRDRGLADCVKLLGFIPDHQLALAYAAADLVVVPTSALEGFGLVTVEALASGTPVLGTPVGGTPEILRYLDPGLVTSSTEPAALADKLSAALTGRVRLPDVTECRNHATRFGWHRVAPRILEVFNEALGGQRVHNRGT